jgi:hypothetical protein
MIANFLSSLDRHVSIEQVMSVITACARAFNVDLHLKSTYTTETISRILCEQNVAIDLSLIDKINSSECLGLGYVLLAACLY